MTYSPDISPNASKQEIFDFVVKKMFAQGKPSLNKRPDDSFPYCVYRSSEGRMCAIGCILPDDLYDPKMDLESLSVEPLIRKHGYLADRTPIKRENLSLLQSLQNAHDAWDLHADEDGCDLDVDIAKQFFEVAEQYSLNPEVIFTTSINGRIIDRLAVTTSA